MPLLKHLPSALKKPHKFFGILALCLLATACNETIFGTGRYIRDEALRQTWRLAATRGDVEAQYKTGTLFCCGEPPRQDTLSALYWWCAAGRAGQRDALLEIGKIYENTRNLKGSAVPYDPVIALAYYTTARRHGNVEAEGYITNVRSKLNFLQYEQAQKYAEAWPNMPCEIDREPWEKKDLIPELPINLDKNMDKKDELNVDEKLSSKP